MSVLTLSGWATPADAIAKALAPGAATFDYSNYSSVEASFKGLAQFHDVEHVIGWSMGGQLALRAIANGIIKPRRLTLISVSYQFRQSPEVKAAMDTLTYTTFRDNYARDPERTAARFKALTAKGDSKFKKVMDQLDLHADVTDTNRWLPWLDDLGHTSLAALDLSKVPHTTLIHGTEDAIVPVAQSRLLAERLPNVWLEEWEGVAHAPHLHDAERLKEAMAA